MILTEKEARQKFCPHQHGSMVFTDCPQNMCVASACMAWRWFDKHEDIHVQTLWWPEAEDYETLSKGEPTRPKDMPAAAVWVPVTGDSEEWDGGHWQLPPSVKAAAKAKAAERRGGFCGLSGKPEVE